MEKISGILPSTPRITNVDLKSSGLSRAGMPSFGRPQATSTGAAREQRQMLEREMFGDLAAATTRPKDPKAAIVDHMADSFFMRKGRTEPGTASGLADVRFDMDASADLDPATGRRVRPDVSLMAGDVADPSRVNADLKAADTSVAVQAEEAALDQPEVGGYLDVRA